MNKNHKYEKDIRRKHVKDMLHSLYGTTNKQSLSERMTDIYHEATKKFIAKGD